jgi:4-amino-4-deoxychorismate lyase
MTQWPILNREAVLDRLSWINEKRNYYAMFNSLLGGIVTDPELMTIPIDDHMVHRGDGVFEAIKCIHNRIYALDEHLDRMEDSAGQIGLKFPFAKTEIKKLCCDVTRIGLNYARSDSASLRLFISRGPGSFTPNPYDTVGSQFYLIVVPFKPVPEEKYRHGASVITSSVLIKKAFYAQIKSCNYLSNVLMKKESVDKGADFAIGIDDSGNIAEGPTENIGIISKDSELWIPPFVHTLKGITALRTMQLAKLIPEIKAVKVRDFSIEDVYEAKEAFMIGTTLDILPVCSVNGKLINSFEASGPIAVKLRELIIQDQVGESLPGLKSLSTLV